MRKLDLINISMLGIRFRSTNELIVGDRALIKLEVGPLRWSTKLRVVHAVQLDDGNYAVGCEFIANELARPMAGAQGVGIASHHPGLFCSRDARVANSHPEKKRRRGRRSYVLPRLALDVCQTAVSSHPAVPSARRSIHAELGNGNLDYSAAAGLLSQFRR